jgi:beta-N-acetylhexosaminidase
MPADEEASIDAIEKAVNEGAITEERINRSAEKILKAKQQLGLFDNRFVNEDSVYLRVNTQEAQYLAQQIADESVTLVKDDSNTIPLKLKKDKIKVFNLSDGSDNINSSYFNDRIGKKFPEVTIIDINSDLADSVINAYKDSTGSNDIVIINLYAKVKYGTGKISILPSQTAFIKALNAKTNKIIVTSFGNPYLLREFPAVPCYIAAYGDADVSIKAVIKAISGEIHFKGKLPVSINSDYRFGMGIIK